VYSPAETPAACTAVGGVWSQPSYTRQACIQSGQMCNRGGNFYAMNSTDCGSCGGHIVNTNYYTNGSWLNYTMIPYTWMAHGWVNLNEMLPNSSISAVSAFIVPYIYRAYYRSISIYLNEYEGALLDLMVRVGCDCDGTVRNGCFSSFTTVGLSNDIISNLGGADSTTSAGTWTTSPNGAPGPVGGLQIGKVFLSSLADLITGGGKKRQSGLNYAIVQNSYGQVVGQLAGNGISVGQSGSANSGLSAQVNTDISIPVAPNYNISVLVQYDPTTGVWTVVVGNVSATFNGNYTTLIAELGQSGVYFPAFLAAGSSLPPVPTNAPTTTVSTGSTISTGSATPRSISATPRPTTSTAILASCDALLMLFALMVTQ